MELMRNKRIGKVIMIVEGAKHEFNLMKKIFVDVLGYTQIEKRRGSAKYYIRKGDAHSIVAVINTETSNIASIDDEDYLDATFMQLIENYDFDIDNAAIYYLFDCDLKSNTDVSLIIDLIKRLKNSRENSDGMRGGMLILSYPSIEAYEIANFIDGSFDLQKKMGKDAKQYINKNAQIISMNKINEESVIHAVTELLHYFGKKEIPINLDDFSETNAAVFTAEEQNLKEKNAYRVLSLLSCVLMDLGILRE